MAVQYGSMRSRGSCTRRQPNVCAQASSNLFAPTSPPPSSPPTVKTLPIIGDTFEYLTDWEKYFNKRTAEFGPVFETSVLGAPVVFVCDAILAKQYLEKYDTITLENESPLLGDAFMFDGAASGKFGLTDLMGRDHARFKRDTFTSSFGPKYLPTFYPTIEAIFREEFVVAAAQGNGVDITEVLHRATMRVVHARIIGRMPSVEESEPVMEAMSEFAGGIPFLLLPKALNPKLKGYYAAKEVLRKSVVVSVADVRAQFEAFRAGTGEEPSVELQHSFLWRLLEVEAAGDGTKLTPQDWAANVFVAFFAGHETTRWSTAGLLMHLDTHPAVVPRLAQELQQLQATLGPDFLSKRIGHDKTVYCDAVIQENMRLVMGASKFSGSLAAQNKRVSMTPTQVGPYELPAGKKVILVTPYLVNSEQEFRTADGVFDMSFRPERFVKGGAAYKPEAFAPFGLGPRMCPGQALASAEMQAVLKLVALEGLSVRFEAPDTEWKMRGVTTSPANSRCTVTWQ